MGLFKFAKKAAKFALKRAKPLAPTVIAAVGGGAAGELAGQVLFPTQQGRGLPALPSVPIGGGALTTVPLPRIRGTPRAAGLGLGLPRGALPLVGPGVCPAGYHPNKTDRSYCVRNRRMNVLNGRAATRAIRRVRGARKMLMKIERQLPRPRTTRRVAGHRARLSHE